MFPRFSVVLEIGDLYSDNDQDEDLRDHPRNLPVVAVAKHSRADSPVSEIIYFERAVITTATRLP